MKTRSVYPIRPAWSSYRIVKQAIGSRTPIQATYGTRRCLNLAKMSRIQLAGDEPWRTAHSHRRPSTCIDEILDQIPAT